MAAASVSLNSNDSKTIAAYLCSTCKNTNTVAKAYCKMCDNFFCGKCVNLHNPLFKDHATFGTKEREKWPVAMATQEFLENCEVHKGEKLKLFCEDHSQLCCNTCVLLSHGQCSKVTLIADTTLCATDHQQWSVKINTILGQLMKLQTNWDNNMKSLQLSYKDRLKELKSMRERINAILDELEKATLKEMDEVKASWNASVKFDVDACSRLHTELTRLSCAIQEIGKKNEELAFIAHQKSEEMIKRVDKYLNNNSIQTEVSLKFIVDHDIEEFLYNLSGLGHTIHITKELTIQGNPDQAIIVTGATQVSVRIPSDTSKYYMIYGICGMFNGQILVADCNNRRLKLLDLQHKVISDFDTLCLPYDICVITPCQVAVAVDTRIVFVSVNSGQLVQDRWLLLPHECIGVAHHQGDLYVTSGNALYKYTLTGTLVNKMYEDTSASSTVSRCKCAVSPSGDMIYVTNNNRHKLLTLAKDGTVISTFTDPELQYPLGVHVTPAGQVLVCGMASNTVIQVDREGKMKIATLASKKDGLQHPKSVFYNWKSGSFIVGQSNENILVLSKQ